MSRGPRAGTVLLLLLAALALAGPLLVRADPLAMDLGSVLAPPSPRHPAGTDALGRDVLARLVHGARPSLLAGLVATITAVALGFVLGALAGLAGRAGDALLVRAADVADAFPVLVGAVALLGLGPRGTEPPAGVRVGVIVGLFAWPRLFRFVRAEIRRLAAGDLATAARAAGASRARLALRHLIPLAAGPALVPAVFIAGGAVVVEAGLGFLGLGVRPPAPSWGNLLMDGRDQPRAWWLVVLPGLCVFLTVLACQLVGDGLRRVPARDGRAVLNGTTGDGGA